MRMMQELCALLLGATLLGCGGGDDDDSQATDTDTTDTGKGTDSADGQDASQFDVWHSAPGTTWQWQLTEVIDTSVDVAMYDVDLTDVQQAVIDGLKAAGRTVICYFSAGSFEDWRDDASAFPAAVIGAPLEGWEGENWLDVRADTVRQNMQARLDLAVSKGCDGVEPDNVDGYVNESGFDLTAADQLEFNAFLADEAHARGLSVGLKNDLEQIAALEPLFDWALNEECLSYDECAMMRPFLDAGKAVFHVEYVETAEEGPAKLAEVCGDTTIKGFSTLIKTWELTPWRLACD